MWYQLLHQNVDWKFPNKQMQKLVSDLHKHQHHTTRHLMSFFESTGHARNFLIKEF